MKHTIIIISFFSILALPHVHAATGKEPQRGRLSITQIQVRNTGDSIELSFKCAPDLLNVRNKERIMVTPVMSDGINQAKFPPFVIAGKKVKAPFILPYDATMKYEDWMKGSVLTFESSVKLCAKQAMLTTATVDGRILQDPDVEIVEITEADKEVEPVLTTAEKLSQDYGFLAHISTRPEFNEENRDKSVSILFKLGSSALLTDYEDNDRNLDLLVNVINQINNSSDSRIANILIAGYASPEGTVSLNSTFAERRACALKEYLMQNTQVATNSFETINGGVDWLGLYHMVNESDMADKETVLRIIDSIPVKGNKERKSRIGELMRLKGGIPYQYMQKYFFPKLRSSTCIKVFYENINNK